MPPKKGGGFLQWDLGVVTYSENDGDDFQGVQFDAYGEKKSGLPPVEQHHAYGFESRALDPDPDETGCTVLYAQQGSQRFAWLANDPRITKRLPLLRKGESRMYGAAGQTIRCHEDGRISLWTSTTNDLNGQGVFFQVGPEGLEFRSPFGYFKFDATGFHVRDRSGARLDLGSGSAPAPLDALASYAGLRAAMVSVEGSAVQIGTDGGLSNQLGTIALLAVIADIATQLSSLGKPVTPATLAAAVALVPNIGKPA